MLGRDDIAEQAHQEAGGLIQTFAATRWLRSARPSCSARGDTGDPEAIRIVH